MTTNNPPDFAAAWRQSWEEWAKAWTALAQPVPEGEKPPPSPSEAWKRSMDRWLNAWTGFLEESMSQPAFAAAAGQTLDRTLDVQKPLRDATEANMQRWLEAINMPSREDVIRLARQLNDVNARLDELGDRVEEILDTIAALRPVASETAGDDGQQPEGNGARIGVERWS